MKQRHKNTKRTYHPKNAPPTTSGGRGLTQIETAYKTTTVGLETYLKHSEDILLQLVWEHEKRKKLYYIQKGEKFRQELDVPNLEKGESEQTTAYAKRIKQKTKHRAQDKLSKKWEEKALH